MGSAYLFYIKEKKHDRSEQTREWNIQWDGITDLFHLGFGKICKNIFLGKKVEKNFSFSYKWVSKNTDKNIYKYLLT